MAEVFITAFGVTGAPLLLVLVVDAAAALLLARSGIEMQGGGLIKLSTAQCLRAGRSGF